MKVFKVNSKDKQILQQGNNQIEMVAEKQALASQEKDMTREGLGEKIFFK